MSQEPPNDQTTTPGENAPREIRSEDLLQGEKILVIVHRGERYRLLVTRSGKLLLQK